MEQHKIFAWTNRALLDIGGEKIGKIEDVRYDDSSIMSDPKWLIVRTGLFGAKRLVVPALEAHDEGSELAVPLTKDRVMHAPHVSHVELLTSEEERELTRYYGLDR